jgi:hypothetical protein
MLWDLKDSYLKSSDISLLMPSVGPNLKYKGWII